MSGFNISPPALRQSADGLVDVVDRLADALTRLEGTLRGYGSPWGTGPIGSLIGELYQGVHDMAMGSLEANAEALSEYAQGLDTMAEDLELLESQIEEGFGFFQSRLAQRFSGP
jgi:hypothetical protein